MNEEQANYARGLADWAESAPSDQFDMTVWISLDQVEDYIRLEAEGIPVHQMREGSCGSSACIAGRVLIDRAPTGTVLVDGEGVILPGQEEAITIPEFAQNSLGVTYEQAICIFYPPAKDAIARLRYVADNPNATLDQIEKAVPSRFKVPRSWLNDGPVWI